MENLPDTNPGLGLGAVDQLKRQEERNKQTALEINRRVFKSNTFPKLNWQHRPASIEEEDADSDIPDSAATELSSYSAFSRTPIEASQQAQPFSSSRTTKTTAAKPAPKIENIRLKVHYADDMRYITILATTPFDEILNHIRRKFGLAGALKLRTRDEDDDMITMADQEDLDTAVAMSLDAAGAERRTAAKLEVC